MADDLDVESWLEAPYKPEIAIESRDSNTRENVSKNSEDKRKSRREDKDSARESRRHRSRSRERRHRSSRHRSRSRSRDQEKRSSRSSRRSSSRSRSDRHRRERRESSREKRRSRTPPRRVRKERSPSPIISEADRDQRTVFVIQLAARLTTSELRDFFSKVGRVRDARIVSDRNSRRSKGVGYVEFYDVKSVEPALALTGQKLLGIPVIVQNTEAEKNRIAEANAAALRSLTSPGRGRGYAFLQYRSGEDSRQALAQMNGFDLGGRSIRVGSVADRAGISSSLDDPDSGLVFNSQSRADLMKKLARKEDLDVMPQNIGVISSVISPVLSRSVVLENMFDPDEETEPDWEQLLESEVKSECSKFGTVDHIHVDPKSKGTIFIRFDSIPSANQSIQSLHGRWFGGRQVIAQCISDTAYASHFPKTNFL